MTLNQLASKIAKLEGKKSQARIGDIREILGILSDLLVAGVGLDQIPQIVTMLMDNGVKRAKKNKKAKK